MSKFFKYLFMASLPYLSFLSLLILSPIFCLTIKQKINPKNLKVFFIKILKVIMLKKNGFVIIYIFSKIILKNYLMLKIF